MTSYFFPTKKVCQPRSLFYMENGKVKVKVFKSLNDRAVTTAELSLGKAVEMPWMGMKLSLLNFYPHARRIVEYQKREYPSGITTSALKVKWSLTFKSQASRISNCYKILFVFFS